MSNVTEHPYGYNPFNYANPSYRFAVWVTHAGKQVQLTKNGEDTVPRHTTWWSGGSAIPGEIKAGESLVLHINLGALFQFTAPGEYTVVVEDGPFMIKNDDPRREAAAAKTSFTLLP
jgi:hypothetical protein